MAKTGKQSSISVNMTSSYEEPPPLTLPDRSKKYASKAAEALAAAQYMSHQRDHRSDNEDIYSVGGNYITSVPPPPPPPPGKPESRRRMKEGNQSSRTTNSPSVQTEELRYGEVEDASLSSAAERRRRRALEAAKQAEMKFAMQFSRSETADEKYVADEDPPLKLELSDSGSDTGSDENDDNLNLQKKKGFFKGRPLMRKGVSLCVLSSLMNDWFNLCISISNLFHFEIKKHVLHKNMHRISPRRRMEIHPKEVSFVVSPLLEGEMRILLMIILSRSQNRRIRRDRLKLL